MPYLLIDGLGYAETERFFYYISLHRLPRYVRESSLSDMACWFFEKKKKETKDCWRLEELYNYQITDDPWDYIRHNGYYLV